MFSGENAPLLNEVICEHLLRQGRLDIADQIVQGTEHGIIYMYIYIHYSVGFCLHKFFLFTSDSS